MNKKLDLNQKSGLPEMTDAQRDALGSKSKRTALLAPVLMIAIGYLIALAIHSFGDTSKYESKIALAKQYNLQNHLIGLILFSWTVTWINFYPMRFKERIMGGVPSNLRSNMLIYKLATD